MARKRVMILFGGKSAEHEVSIRSARAVLAALDRDRYEPVLVGVAKDGSWRLGEASRGLLESGDLSLRALGAGDPAVALLPAEEGGAALVAREGGREIGPVDVAFPLVHGTNGEDGTLQGLLELAGIPYVGAGVLGSALCMDKEVSKRLLRDAGIPVAPWVCLRAPGPGRELLLPAERIEGEIGFPCFVKPASCGSSVGVSRVGSAGGLAAAVEGAFRYDRKVLVEGAVAGRELECSVLGNRAPIASVPGEVIPRGAFYDYEAKYVDADGAALEIPAGLSDEETFRVREMAVAAYLALEGEGMARVDFFLRPDGELLVNELNTIPGFTATSMYPKLWEASGMPFAALADRLITLAVERWEERSRLRTSR